MNFLTLKERILQKLNESTSSPQFWSLATVGDIINEGYDDLIAGVRVLEQSVTLSTVANQMIYDLASDCLEIDRMYYNTQQRLIKPIGFTELIRRNNQWFSQTTNTYPWVRINNVGTQKVMLYPKVTTSEADCITYWYKYIQDEMSLDSDTPSIPKTFHDALMDYAFSVCLLRVGSQPSKQKSASYLASYYDKKAKLSGLSKNQINKTEHVRDWA